jgi:murein DD-endopeptidase MepM/ murein hydrolase activator NlpD
MSFAFIVKNRGMRKWFWVPVAIILIEYILPKARIIPVKGASIHSWNSNSFWAYPWGTSITYKSIDIFADKGTVVTAITHGIVVYTYEGGKGGKSVMVWGSRWHFHNYAHLDDIKTVVFKPVKGATVIRTVGDTGNAKEKPPHLHYAITSPYPKLYDAVAVKGWKRMFYLNPDIWLR